MCGIAGYAGSRPPGDDRVAAALAALGHRGPDGSGVRRFATPAGRHVVLLHTRLRIIDLDPRADQPFNVGSTWLAYNGEVYDYREAAARLRAEGERMTTTCDTEVLARAIRRWGWRALDDLEGMWAFARYDEADGSLALCRDRFGEKPLFVLRDPWGVYFASEPKAIHAMLGRRLPPDREHLRRYLVNGYKALHGAGATFLAGLEALPPATLLVLADDGTERATRYWRPALDPEPGMAREEAVRAVRDAVVRAVDLRLRADVPLAFCLSGGVDSVSLASVARRVLGHQVHGFTVVNTDARYEEEDMVRAAVDGLGIDHVRVPLDTAGFLPRLRGLVRMHDAPVATVTWFAHWLLMGEVAARGFRVAVSGTAADELFTGYFDHHLLWMAEVREEGPEAAAAERAAWERHVLPVVRNPHLRDPDLFVRDPGFRDHLNLDAARFSAFLATPFAEPLREVRHASGLLRNRMANELFAEAVPVILAEDDLNAMAWSVENRSPYLDRRLVELAYRIPTRHLVRDGYRKVVLRDAMRGIAPDAVLDNRRKVGFNAPIGDLLDRHDPAVRAEVLADSPVWDLVRREPVAELLARPGPLPNSESKFLFSVLGAKMFLEEVAA